MILYELGSYSGWTGLKVLVTAIDLILNRFDSGD